MNKKPTTQTRLSGLLRTDNGDKAPKAEAGGARKAVAPAKVPKAQPPGARAPGDGPTASPPRTPAPFGKATTRTVGLSMGGKSLPLVKITAWSFSRLADWEQCPLKAKLKHVQRIKEPGSPAMERGSLIHKLAEDYTNGEIKTLPPELARFKPQFVDLKKSKPECESQWAFDEEWNPVDWFAKNAWLRVKTDVSAMPKGVTKGIIIDHKTGKVKDEHEDQLSLYALAFFIMYPKATEVLAGLWYLDDGTEKQMTFTRDQLPALKRYWLDRVTPMMNDTVFPAKPSRLCSWCYFRKSSTGHCKF